MLTSFKTKLFESDQRLLEGATIENFASYLQVVLTFKQHTRRRQFEIKHPYIWTAPAVNDYCLPLEVGLETFESVSINQNNTLALGYNTKSVGVAIDVNYSNLFLGNVDYSTGMFASNLGVALLKNTVLPKGISRLVMNYYAQNGSSFNDALSGLQAYIVTETTLRVMFSLSEITDLKNKFSYVYTHAFSV